MLTKREFCEAILSKKSQKISRNFCGLDAIDDPCLGVAMHELGMLDSNLALKEFIKNQHAIHLIHILDDETKTLTTWEILDLLPENEGEELIYPELIESAREGLRIVKDKPEEENNGPAR